VALEYLEAIGVDVATAVRAVIVTHWHDDHIQGISDVFAAASGANLVCSVALNSDEFYTLVRAAKTVLTVRDGSGVSEFRWLLEELQRRQARGIRRAARGPVWAISNRLLARVALTAVPHAEVIALSPSDATVTLAQNEIAQALPKKGEPRRRVVAQKPNQTCVAVWVQAGEVRVLLGADLEVTTSSAQGWDAVVGCAERPAGRAGLVKVPHHGSSGAHHPGMWSDMVDDAPIAVLTPKRASGLPKQSDVQRILAQAQAAYSVAPVQGDRPPRRSKTVERTIREVVRSRRTLESGTGHVRIRADLRDPTPSYVVRCFDGAFKL